MGWGSGKIADVTNCPLTELEMDPRHAGLWLQVVRHTTGLLRDPTEPKYEREPRKYLEHHGLQVPEIFVSAKDSADLRGLAGIVYHHALDHGIEETRKVYHILRDAYMAKILESRLYDAAIGHV